MVIGTSVGSSRIPSLDRVEVLSSAPPLGKVDIYERWAGLPPGANLGVGSLVVVSLGTAAETR